MSRTFCRRGLLTLPLCGDMPPSRIGGPEPAATPSKPGRTALTVAPAAAPSPALRYELLPRLRDKTPGNAAVGYLRAAVLRPAWPKDPVEGQALNDKLDRWMEGSVEQLPVPEVKEFLKKYREVFKEADSAARMTHCDWHQGRGMKPEDLEALLPSVQANREIIRYLTFRHRLELAEKRTDDAVRTLQTGFQLGKHVGEGRTMIEMLVGIALASVMVGRVEDTIRQPGSPNLYWALTALPRPFIDPRPSLEGETEFMTSFVPGLRELEKGPVPEEQAMRALEGAIRELGRASEPDGGAWAGWRRPSAGPGVAAFAGPAAKKDLLARGWPKKDVDAMPAAQAVILRDLARHREAWDDQAKLFFVPYPVAAPELDRLAERGRAQGGREEGRRAVLRVRTGVPGDPEGVPRPLPPGPAAGAVAGARGGPAARGPAQRGTAERPGRRDRRAGPGRPVHGQAVRVRGEGGHVHVVGPAAARRAGEWRLRPRVRGDDPQVGERGAQPPEVPGDGHPGAS